MPPMLQYELALPYQVSHGDDKGKWFIITTTAMPDTYAGYLDIDGNIESMRVIDHTKCFYSSEADVHAAASNYYLMFGELYPYTAEWYKAVGVVQSGNDGKPSGTIQSEPMEF